MSDILIKLCPLIFIIQFSFRSSLKFTRGGEMGMNRKKGRGDEELMF